MPWGSLLLLAGPNGAGKTTLFKALRGEQTLESYKALNADNRTLDKLLAAGYDGFNETPIELLKQFFIESATEVYDETINYLKLGENVCLETVLSTDKYCALVDQIIAGGGRFELFYVALRSYTLSQERVAIRVLKGGHDVPTERLVERWKRSLHFLPWFALRAHEVIIFDNSETAPVMLAKGGGGNMMWRVPQDAVFPELRLALQQAFLNLN